MYGQALTDLFVGHASSNRPRVSEQRTVEGTSLPSAHPSLRKFHAARQLLGPSRASHRRGRSCNSLPPPPPDPTAPLTHRCSICDWRLDSHPSHPTDTTTSRGSERVALLGDGDHGDREVATRCHWAVAGLWATSSMVPTARFR